MHLQERERLRLVPLSLRGVTQQFYRRGFAKVVAVLWNQPVYEGRATANFEKSKIDFWLGPPKNKCFWWLVVFETLFLLV